MDKKVAALLNEQVNKEFYSAYLYLDFSNYFEARGLDGFANWYKIQAQEERDHAMLFYQYLHNNNAKVTLGAIAQPDKVLDSDMTVLKAGLEHELYVTGLINTIYAAAYESSDPGVAAVDESGTVTALSPGRAVITLRYEGPGGSRDFTCAVTCAWN